MAKLKSTSAKMITKGEAGSSAVVRRHRRTTIFLSYRREDSKVAAEHLRASLAKRFGATAIFRDLDSIDPGEDFSQAIEREIKYATVVLVLIGKRWLTTRDRSGRRRLFLPGDFVRREIELAMQARRSIIPILVDGAGMPKAADLPKSIAALEKREAVELPWHEGIAKLGTRIIELEKEFGGDYRVDHGAVGPAGARGSSDVALYAMELSLRNQGLGDVRLDGKDLKDSLDRISDVRLTNAVLVPDLIYVLDLVGVKAKSKPTRYVARSKAIHSLEQIPSFLEQHIPVLAGMMVKQSWFEEPITATGLVEAKSKEPFVGGLLGVITDWDRRKRIFTAQTRMTAVGKRGVLRLNFEAAEECVDKNELRAIDAAPMPVPVSLKAQRSLEARRRRTGHKDQ